MDIIATRPQFNETLTVTVDPARRTLTGPDAEQVRHWVETWDGVGILYGTQPVPAPDPLGNLRDLAVLLADAGYTLPRDLADHLPPAEAIPTGAVA